MSVFKTSATDRSTAESALLEHVDNRRVMFEYNSQKAILWLRPYMTYGRLAELLGAIFGIPRDHKITFIFSAGTESVTGVADSKSPQVNMEFATARLPGVVLLTSSPQTS
ncbi:hypothetical protein COOONC_15545 [Cooperia oncophora]